MIEFIIIGEPNDPWLCFAVGHLDTDTMVRVTAENGYVAHKKMRFNHEHWVKDEDGWRKSSGHNKNSIAVTVIRR